MTQWDAIAQAQANLKALSDEPKVMLPDNPVDSMDGKDGKQDSENELVKAWSSDEYKTAWAKTLMGKPLTTDEQNTYSMVNEAFTHTTENTSIVIPKTVTKGIWEMAAEMFPYFADVTKTYVNGVLSMIQEDSSSDAAWYEENQETEDGKETFKEFLLSGCELARSITVSWKLKEMSIEDFIPYIQRKMARKMGAAAGYGATHGKGTANKSKPEPVGTVTALLQQEGTPQVVKYKAGTLPTYQNILTARSLISSGYSGGLKIYANNKTVWTRLAAIVDTNKRPIFLPDPTGNGQIRILGMVVKEDDSMKDGEILFSNPSDGFHMNINKEMTMMTEDHVKQRKTDYCGYAIMDGNIVTDKAHALLIEDPAAAASSKAAGQTGGQTGGQTSDTAAGQSGDAGGKS